MQRKKQQKEDYFNSQVRVNKELINQSIDRPTIFDESLAATDETGMRLQLLQLIERLNYGIKAFDGVSIFSRLTLGQQAEELKGTIHIQIDKNKQIEEANR